MTSFLKEALKSESSRQSRQACGWDVWIRLIEPVVNTASRTDGEVRWAGVLIKSRKILAGSICLPELDPRLT